MKQHINKGASQCPLPEIKAINIRMSYDLWRFLKQQSLDKEVSVNSIMNKCLTNYKNRVEGKS